jgi:hypothetical protein
MKPMKPLIALLAGLSLTVLACEGELSGPVATVQEPAAINTSMDETQPAAVSAPARDNTYDAGPTEISGRIVGLRTVAVDGADVDHVLADIQTADSGRTFLVDLGPAESLKRKSLKPVTGDAITVSGEPGMFNGSSMLVADRLNNKPLAFEEQQAERRADTGQADSGQKEMLGIRQRLVAGKVLDVKEADINGQNHMLAKVETFKGHIAVIDLGMKEQMPNLSIQKGQQIFAFGTVGRLNKLPLIVAEKVGQIMDVPGRELQEQSQPTTYQRPVNQPAANNQPASDNQPAADNQPASDDNQPADDNTPPSVNPQTSENQPAR